MTAGNHSFESKIIEARKIENGEEKELIRPKNNSIVLGNKTINFDYDTDNDGIGDKIDKDDDNDGYSDEVEIKTGSNPKSKISTPKTAKSLKEIEKITKEVKKASDNIFIRANNFRKKTKEYFEKKIINRKKELQEDQRPKKVNITKTGFKKKPIDISKKIINTEKNKKEKRDYYLIFLRMMFIIFNSVILSVLFFIFIV